MDQEQKLKLKSMYREKYLPNIISLKDVLYPVSHIMIDYFANMLDLDELMYYKYLLSYSHVKMNIPEENNLLFENIDQNTNIDLAYASILNERLQLLLKGKCRARATRLINKKYEKYSFGKIFENEYSNVREDIDKGAINSLNNFLDKQNLDYNLEYSDEFFVPIKISDTYSVKELSERKVLYAVKIRSYEIDRLECLRALEHNEKYLKAVEEIGRQDIESGEEILALANMIRGHLKRVKLLQMTYVLSRDNVAIRNELNYIKGRGKSAYIISEIKRLEKIVIEENKQIFNELKESM